LKSFSHKNPHILESLTSTLDVTFKCRFIFATIMRVEKVDTDYYVHLSEADIKKTISKERVPWSVFPQHPAISARVESLNACKEELLELVCTVAQDELSHPQTHDNIYFGRDDRGPIVHVFYPLLFSLLSEREFLVTRYDGYEAKIWIRRDYQEKPPIHTNTSKN